MDFLLMLLAVYGLCFSLQNKVGFLWRINFLEPLLTCTFCLGFHAGWMVYVATWGIDHLQYGESPFQIAQMLNWAFAGAAWCYIVDGVMKWIEGGE